MDIHPDSHAEIKLKNQTDGATDAPVERLDAPMPDHCFLRWPGKPGTDYDPKYVANGREAIGIFAEYLATNRRFSGDSLLAVCGEMHRVFSAGTSGANQYKRLDRAASTGDTGANPLADWPAGKLRPDVQARAARPETDLYANYVNRAVLDSSEPLQAGPLRVPGIPAEAWPRNRDYHNPEQNRSARFHEYPSARDLHLYFNTAATLLEKARSPREDSAGALASIADYYYVMVNARPYAVLNNGMFMAQVNVLLRLRGLEPVGHGELDHLAHRFQLEDFHTLFEKHVTEGLPREPALATCQCIVAHPSKPKFMAIKHKGGHLPPTVKIPYQFDLARNINHVLEGIQRKYGLRTIALRHLVWLPEYHCIEVEILGRDARRMAAVWVGSEDYRRIHGENLQAHDPFVAWLEEMTQGPAPPQRRPWERTGWFEEASHWIDYQLDSQNIQRTGAIVQHGAFRSEAMILRVPTARGPLYFKAAYGKRPNEVALTRFLATHWPKYVTELVAADEARNWMLMPDYAESRQELAASDVYALAASELAQMQMQSARLTDELEALGCDDLGLNELKSFVKKLEEPDAFPALFGGRLTPEERNSLAALAPRLADLCDQLADFSLPTTLIHPDFCAANLFMHSGSVRIIDWANSGIGHPFFSLLKLLRANHEQSFVGAHRDPVVQAYLQVFHSAETETRLFSALELAVQLQHAWRLLRWSLQVPHHEPRSPAMARLQRLGSGIARELVAARSTD